MPKLFALLAIGVAGLGAVQTVEGQTWTGAVDSDWNNPANWSSDRVPGDTEGVNPTIPGPNGPIINEMNVTAAQVTITYSGTDLPTILSITNNGSFTTLYGLDILGGQIVVFFLCLIWQITRRNIIIQGTPDTNFYDDILIWI